MKRQIILVAVLAFLIRVPFLNQPIQGDDPYYIYGAEHAQIEPFHPLNVTIAWQGGVADMRGHPHGPMNSWILGTLLAVFGDVEEVPFHAAYALFSVIAALAMFSIARRFCDKPLWATLLFLVVPPFVVNGTSFESDLPFLAFWLAAIALFLRALETKSVALLLAVALFSAVAALQAYQAVLLAPILAVYLWQNKRDWMPAWAVLLSAPLAIVLWQLWEWQTSGQLPASILIGYMQSGSLQSTGNKLANAAALIAHAAWIVGPILVLRIAPLGSRWQWAVAVATAMGAAFIETNPLFWASVGVGVLLLLIVIEKDFLAAWIWIFFIGALIIFFAGAARYLLPISAPVAILVARSATPKWLAAGFVSQLTLSFALAAANYQHWQITRDFAMEAARQAKGNRVWSNAELGMRFYLEKEGALPLMRGQVLRPGDLVVTSELGKTFDPSVPLARISELFVVPSIPLRLISLDGGSGYSTSAKGLLPFEISNEPVDHLRIETVLERKAELSYLDPKGPKAADHIISGLFPDGWMSGEAILYLKTPAAVKSLEVDVYFPPNSPARTIELLADGAIIATKMFEQPGLYQLKAPFHTESESVTVGLRVNATFRSPPDQRDLGVLVVGVGMR